MTNNYMEKFEFDYESGASGSFLVASIDASENVLTYQVEMLANNPNKNILPLDIRQKDAKHNFYYNITSKLALSQFLKRNRLKRDEFISIFSDIVKTILTSKDYLLSDKSFLLKEDYIYINPNSMEVSLVYLPLNFELNINDTLKDFTMNFIMYSANIDETNSDNFLQRVLNLLKSDTFSILEFDNLLKELKAGRGLEQRSSQPAPVSVPKVESQVQQVPNEVRKEQPKPQVSKPQPHKAVTPTPPPQVQAPSQQNAIPPRPGIPKSNAKQSPVAKKAPVQVSPVRNTAENIVSKMKYKSSVIIIGSAIQAIIAIGFIALLASGSLDSLGNDMTINIFGLLILGGAASYVLWKSLLTEKNKVESVSAKKEPAPAARPPVNMEKREIRTVSEAPSSAPARPVGNIPPQPQVMPQVTANTYSQLNETTVLSPGGMNETTVLGYSNAAYPYLQGKKDGVLEEIKINKPSFVIGRLRDQVDYVSQNNAVGKVHAEIISRDGSYFIKDLNSRNGTFVNGERLDSNTEREIKNNDKVTFANSEYVFIIP